MMVMMIIGRHLFLVHNEASFYLKFFPYGKQLLHLLVIVAKLEDDLVDALGCVEFSQHATIFRLNCL